MNILQLSDIHGNINNILKMDSQIRNADLVLVTGDIARFGALAEARDVMSLLLKRTKNVLAIPGNCDTPGIDGYLSELGVNLHADTIRRDGYIFTGLGGSLPCPGRTPLEFEEKELEIILRKSVEEIEDKSNLILVLHQPPLNTVTDRIGENEHVGSRSIREIIAKEQPLLALCGHIHEGIGIEKIGRTTLVNPGPFKDGHYAMIQLDGDQVNAELHSL